MGPKVKFVSSPVGNHCGREDPVGVVDADEALLRHLLGEGHARRERLEEGEAHGDAAHAAQHLASGDLHGVISGLAFVRKASDWTMASISSRKLPPESMKRSPICVTVQVSAWVSARPRAKR